MSLGPWEIFLIFLVVLLLFGAARLPKIARSMGEAVNEFKKAKDDIMNHSEVSDCKEPKEHDDKKVDDNYLK